MDIVIRNLKDKSMSRLTVYKHLGLALDSKNKSLDIDNVNTLFDVINNDLLQATQNGVNSLILNSVKLIIEDIKDDKTYSEPLKNITLTLFKHLITIARFPQVQSNQKICWEMISSLPDSILKNVLDSNEKQMSSFISQSLNAVNIDNPVKIVISIVLQRWLKMLNEEELTGIITACLNIWFGYSVPAMIASDETQSNVAIQTMEMVLPKLKCVDYLSHPKWLSVIAELQEKKKYTPALLQMFNKKNKLWKDVWRVMLYLLERDLKKNGLLINSLLPVLEQAFREETTRKEAFECWKVLIDVSLSKEKETNNSKIVKLLSTPLVANNAKSLEIAIDKFHIWWFYIINLSHEILTYQENTLYPFLNFCFGNGNVNEQIIPGLVFPPLQKLTISCLVEMFGHESSCNGCVGEEIAHMKKPILSNVLFDGANKKWLNVVKTAIVVIGSEIAESLDNEEFCTKMKRKMRCIWTSLLKIARNIVNPNLKVLTFRNILEMLSYLCENHLNNQVVPELIIEHLIPLMVSKGIGYSSDFLTDNRNYDADSNLTPIRALILILLSPKFGKCTWAESKVLPFKELVCIEMDNSLMNFCTWIVRHLSTTEPSISLWCHWSEALANSKYSNINDISEIVLLWPIDKNIECREVVKIVHSWKKLCLYITQKITMSKNINLMSFEENLITKVTKACECVVEPRIVMCSYFVSTIAKHRAMNNPVSQVTNQPLTLRVLQELLTQLKKFEPTDYIVMATIEIVDCISCILASFNSRRATPEYLQILTKTSELALKTVNCCLQNLIFPTHSVEYAKKLNGLFGPYLTTAFSSTCCQCVIDLILTFVKKDEELVLIFKDVLQLVYKSQALNSATAKKIDKLLKDKNIDYFKSPQQKCDGNGKVKTAKCDVADANSEEFVVIKPTWKFDPKKLTEHQKEILTRRRENIPALYEDLSQSQDDYNMKTWKPAGYANDETSESSKDQDSSRDKVKDTSVSKENVKTIPFGDKPDCDSINVNIGNNLKKDQICASEKKVLSDSANRLGPPNNNIAKSVTENAEGDTLKLAIVASPKVVKSVNGTSFQSRLERKVIKLREDSKKYDGIPTTTPKTPDISLSLALSPIVQKMSDNNVTPSRKSFEPSTLATTPVSTNQTINETNKKMSGNNVTPPRKSFESFTLVKTPVSTNQTINETNIEPSTPKSVPNIILDKNLPRTPETDRPMRQRKRPDKFDPDDNRFIGKRRASTSVIDIQTSSPSLNKSTKANSIISAKADKKSTKDDDTPTKIEKRKKRLMKVLQIDTVDGHPNKDLFDLDKSTKRRTAINEAPEPKRRRLSINGVASKDEIYFNQNKQKPGPKRFKNTNKLKITDGSEEEVITITQADSQDVNTPPQSEDNAEPMNIETITITQSQPVIISDEPNSETIDKSVILVEPSATTSSGVTEKYQSNVQNTAIIPELVKEVIIELSDEEENENVADRISISPASQESEDVIQSSQESESNMSVTTRRIVTVINCKQKPLSPPKNNTPETFILNSGVIVPDTEENTADIDTLPLANETASDSLVAEKSTEAIIPSASVTMEVANADTETVEVETQMDENVHDSEMIIEVQPESFEKNDNDNEQNVEGSTVIQDSKTESLNIENVDNEGIVEPEIMDAGEEMDIVMSEEVANLADDNANSNNDLADRSTILSSPYEHDFDDRCTELLNNTLDISPIKGMDHGECSKNKIANELESLGCKVLSDNDSSSDSDQGKLSPIKPTEISPSASPHKSSVSPNKTSPSDKASLLDNASPPRGSVSSPSSSANQNKSRPLMKHLGGRGAQMLGMCKRGPADNTDGKFSNVNSLSPVRMIARKNLHSFYGMSTSNEPAPETKCDDENLLEFNKPLPSPYASPSGPILKKVQDDQSSPLGKKKRVSFHDPPVSMQLSIEKYIEAPSTLRSPQRKPVRNYKDEPASFLKQPKVVYCLAKKIEAIEPSSLNDDDPNETNLSQMCSLEMESQQPVVVLNNALLDDTLPIYPPLCDCQIPISEIASDLTSNACKTMFLNDVGDSIKTIADLAKLTELQVNRLPISYPKISTAKKVLSDFESAMKSVEKELNLEKMDVDPEEVPITLEDCPNEQKETLELSPKKIYKDNEISLKCSEKSENLDIVDLPGCQNNVHIFGEEWYDLNTDEGKIKLVEKFLENKNVSAHISQNIHKYFRFVPK